jgi:tetratricopeptide (TPR) repeat protein
MFHANDPMERQLSDRPASETAPPELPVTLSVPVDQALALADQHLQAGRLPASEAICREILRTRPNYAPALHLLALIAYQVGKLPLAIELARGAIAADATVALYHCNLGEMLRLAGDRDAALAAGRRALALDPNLPQAFNNVGIVYYERGEFHDAAAHYRQAISFAPNYAEAHSNLGNALRAQKKYDDALLAYQHARQLRPDYAEAINNMGTALRDMGREAEAEAAYRQALTIRPDDPGALNNLALALKDGGRFDEASAVLDRSLSVDPNNVKTLTYLALLRIDQKRIVDAEMAAQRALMLAPDDPEAINTMGLVRYEQQNLDDALTCFRRSIALKPDFADGHNSIGNLLKERGELAGACEAYERAIALDPSEVAYYVNFVDARKFVADDPYLAAMEAIARTRHPLTDTAQYQLNFSLAKAYDDIGRHDDAFACMLRANTVKRGRIAYDEAHTLGLFDRIRSAFDRRLFEANPGGGCHSSLPVFVIGMPRSGTTLIEQILASHPAIHGAGELSDFDQLARQMCDAGGKAFRIPEDAGILRPGDLLKLGEAYVAGLQRLARRAERITDKMPANFLYAGLIHLALPRARIIHVLREPRDTCLSCYSKLFTAEQNFTYDLGELGRYYRKYAELMMHWRDVLPEGRMLEIRYDDVIADLEGSARRLVDHCGLDWDPRCIAFHEARRPVRTASAAQVRRPIYRTSLGRWRAYETHLAPLLVELGDLAEPAGPQP